MVEVSIVLVIKTFQISNMKKQLSFAAKAKKILDQFKDRKDPVSIKTRDALLNKLKQEQEYIRAKQAQAEQISRQGMGLGPMDGSGPNRQMFAYGGPTDPPDKLPPRDRNPLASFLDETIGGNSIYETKDGKKFEIQDNWRINDISEDASFSNGAHINKSIKKDRRDAFRDIVKKGDADEIHKFITNPKNIGRVSVKQKYGDPTKYYGLKGERVQESDIIPTSADSIAKYSQWNPFKPKDKFNAGKYVGKNMEMATGGPIDPPDTLNTNVTLNPDTVDNNYIDYSKYINSLKVPTDSIGKDRPFSYIERDLDYDRKLVSIPREENNSKRPKLSSNFVNEYAYGGGIDPFLQQGMNPDDEAAIIAANADHTPINNGGIYMNSRGPELLNQSIGITDPGVIRDRIDNGEGMHGLYTNNYNYNNVQKDSRVNNDPYYTPRKNPFASLTSFGNIWAMANMEDPSRGKYRPLSSNARMEYVNREGLVSDISRTAASTRAALTKKSPGNFRNYALQLNAIGASNAKAISRALLGADNIETARRKDVTNSKDKFAVYNNNQRLMLDENYAKDKAAADSTRAAYTQAIGQNIADAGQDWANSQDASDLVNYYRSTGMSQAEAEAATAAFLREQQIKAKGKDFKQTNRT